MRRTLSFILLLTVGGAWAGEPAKKPAVIAKPDAFKTLVNPNCSHCVDEAKKRAGELRDDDCVLSWIRGYSDGGAIPYRFFLNPYRVISDTYGVFVYDPDAGYARGFAPSLDFSFYGWRNGVMVMKHKDGTLYSCLTGIAFDGPKKGGRLQPVPTLVSDWGFWLKHYPRGVAYNMFEKYQPIELPKEINEDSRKSRGPADKRLPEDTLILGVVAGKNARVYPQEVLAKSGLLREEVEGQPRVILWYGPTKTAAAYQPLASPPKKDSGKPRPVTLEADAKVPAAPFIDKETGSRWDIAGRAVEGELKGWTLPWLDGVQVKWFARAAEYPETSIYQEKVAKAAALGAQTRLPTAEEVKQYRLDKKVGRANGLYITGVDKGGPAEQAGLKVGDMLLALDNNRIYSQDEMDDFLRLCEPRAKIRALVKRAGTFKEESVPVTLDAGTFKAEGNIAWQFAGLAQLDAALAAAKKEGKIVLVGLSGSET